MSPIGLRKGAPMIKEVVDDLITQKKVSVVPLFPNQKETHDKQWQLKRYTTEHFLEDSNVGVNLHLSGWIDLDFDNDRAVYFGNKYAPQNTLKLARVYPDGRKEITHYFFENNNSLKDNDIRKLRGDTVLELRCNGQTVVHGQTPSKDDPSIMVKREWVNNVRPIYVENLQEIVNKIFFAVAICDYNVGANLGALKLDACIMRYTKWTDAEREDFLYDVCGITDPNSKDYTLKKMQRHVASNNKETKNAGYISFANHVGADAKEIKKLFDLIGNIPQSDNYEKVKSIVDFNDKAIDMDDLMQREIPPLINAVNPILPEGFGAIAGRPKAMKSFTMLDVAYAVQNGTPFLNHTTTQGDVLYIALEDSERRIKDRVKKLGLEKLKHPKILLQNDVPFLGYGFEECLENWIKDSTNARLIIIDTLARIKPRQSKRGAGTAYDMDNELLNKIQTLAVQNNITIAFVTHLSKQTTDYSWDRIQGSVGIQGMTDFMWLIDRGDNAKQASIVGRGRDMNDFEYACRWDDEKWRYTFEGDLQITTMNTNRREVLDIMVALDNNGIKEISPRDVCKHANVSVTSKDGRRLSKTMQRMAENFDIWKGKKYGTYTIKQKINL